VDEATFMPFKIWNDGDAGRHTHIEVDGEDVSRHLQSLYIEAHASTGVTIKMNPIVHEVPERRFKTCDDPVDGERIEPAEEATRLIFGTAETQALLIKHGWTPPKED
jgi:hypothetical protein